MKMLHNARGTTFEDLAPGSVFRFPFEGRFITALKMRDPKDGSGCALVLISNQKNWPRFHIFIPKIALDRPEVVELLDVSVKPVGDAVPGPGPGSVTEPGGIELRENKFFLVIPTPKGQSRRVNLESGDIVLDVPGTVLEIHREWELVQTINGETVSLYQHMALHAE
ncbi:MAG TPA: hypothetical protein VEJ16_00670 [Alphaproteobacteria bacterium]|nr:hypothetical protein [Alphaproteobacteria bacterium]